MRKVGRGEGCLARRFREHLQGIIRPDAARVGDRRSRRRYPIRDTEDRNGKSRSEAGRYFA